MNYSSLQGYAHTTYAHLKEKLGEPSYKREGTYRRPTLNDMKWGDGKISVEWETESFTVYDYKEDATPKGLHYWHIGGYNSKALESFENIVGVKTTTNKDS